MIRSWMLLSVALIALLTGCAEPSKVATASPVPDVQPTLAMTVGDYRIEKPIDVGRNVQLVPISTVDTPKPLPQESEVITLAEAKKQGVVDISEAYDSQYENSLRVTNRGTRPILLIGGDLLAGGHQDRIVAHDVLVHPGKSVDVEVFCVEQGRSTGSTEQFQYQDTVVPDRVRRASFHGQEAVWAQVDRFNSASGFSRGSLTIMSGIGSERVKKAIENTLGKVQSELSAQPRVVGVLFVVDGKVKSGDLFGSSNLFSRMGPSLLRGYLMEAAMSEGPSDQPVNFEECASFLREINRGRRRGRTHQGDANYAKVAAGTTQGIEMPAQNGQVIHGNYARGSE